MNKEEYSQYLGAVDFVCLRCTENTMDNENVCEECPVRKSVTIIVSECEKRKQGGIRMKTYAITIKETLSKTVLIKADNLDSAVERVEEAHKNGEVVLDYEDYDDVDVEPSPYWEDAIFSGTKGERDNYMELQAGKMSFMRKGRQKYEYSQFIVKSLYW